MTKIIYRESAFQDLADIHNYYAAISEQINDRVFADIYSAIETLELFPFAGRELPDGRRRLVSIKYRFVISHKSYDDTVEIVGVYRRQNR